MDIAPWFARLQRLIADVQTLDLGYPVGAHTIFPPADKTVLAQFVQKTGLASTHPLVTLYSHCNGIDLPDVHNGYFIHNVERILHGLETGEPTRLATNLAETMVVFGSDGGGSRFVIRTQGPTEVLYLPLGAVHNAIFEDERTPPTVLAPDFFAFLRRLEADINAFLADRDDWVFMA